jgi:hypothetical protein
MYSFHANIRSNRVAVSENNLFFVVPIILLALTEIGAYCSCSTDSSLPSGPQVLPSVRSSWNARYLLTHCCDHY